MPGSASAPDKPSPLALLAHALRAPGVDEDPRTDAGFAAHMAELLMAQVFAADPKVRALPDGTSILVAACHASPKLGLAWWRLRGAEAWLPTAKNKCPALEVFPEQRSAWSSASRGQHLFNTALLDACSKKDARNFMRDAMAVAMPLRVAQVQKGPLPSDIFDRAENQKKFIHLLLEHHQFQQDWVLRALVGFDGALPQDVKLDADDLAASNTLSPHHPLLDVDALESAKARDLKTSVWVPWHEHWRQYRMRKGDENILPWLQRHGIDVQEHAAALLQERLAALQEKPSRGRAPSPKQLWPKLKAAIDNVDGWQMEHEGSLVWQTVFHRTPGLLPVMLADPPPVPLSQCSTAGENLWRHVIGGYTGEHSVQHLLRLHARLPLSPMDYPGPLVWAHGTWRKAPLSMLTLFDRACTAPDAMEVWIGADSQQVRKGVADILASLSCDREANTKAAQVAINMLFDPRLPRDRMSDELKYAASIIQEVAAIHPDARDSMPNVLTHPFQSMDRPTPGHVTITREFLSSILSRMKLLGEREEPEMADQVRRIVATRKMELDTKPSANRRRPASRL